MWYISKANYPFGSQGKVFFTFDKKFWFQNKGSSKQISYEHRVYESEDVRSLYRVISHEFRDCKDSKG